MEKTALMTLPPATRRLVLTCYVAHQATQRPMPNTDPLLAKLRVKTWVPTPDDCPVPWEDVQQWYDGLNRTARTFVDSY